MTTQTRNQFIKAIAEIGASMPPARLAQLYEYALFLQSHPLPLENPEQVASDEAQWEAQFAATDDAKLAELVASVEAEIAAGRTTPMFDDNGEFNEPE